MTGLIWTIFLSLTACSNYAGGKSQSAKIISDCSDTLSHVTNSAETVTLNMQHDELVKIYTKAIAEFIRAAYHKDNTTYDTLYFGKHIFGQTDDFPEMELPKSIEKTQIRIVAPEVGQMKQKERKSLVYVNMMGWVDKQKAEFLFVVFSNGVEHQYDYFIDFKYNTSTNIFELDKIEFENYLHYNGKNPKRITI